MVRIWADGASARDGAPHDQSTEPDNQVVNPRIQPTSLTSKPSRHTAQPGSQPSATTAAR
eukprot:2828322-Pyramimonas_sp.AAC.1